MQLIVISDTKFSLREAELVTQLFSQGLSIFHLRKPRASKSQLITYIKNIPEEFRDRIIIHTHHSLALSYKLKGIHISRRHKKSKFSTWLNIKYYLWRKPQLYVTTSFHNIADLLDEMSYSYNYVFLSPVFDSISKKGYLSNFTELQITTTLEKTKCKVIALGGVDDEKVVKAQKLGFSGVAVVGYIWESDDPVQSYIKIKEIASGNASNTQVGLIKPIKVSF